MRSVAFVLLLGGCVIGHPPEVRPEVPPEAAPRPSNCPAPIAVAPKPVWPDTCVADWYAKAELPPCVEDYLASLKRQQKSIARKHRAGSR